MSDIWDKAYDNTTSLRIQNEHLSTCKTCNNIVKNQITSHRQMIGNCYQTITTCEVCKLNFVLDEHQNYYQYLENIS